ncbi:MAG: glycogen/starch/alpha-glucan phosphorylase, partial [Lachnospiraceae bacterium]|nr:glycogen/starch/alpha-glucan phosphorylase [Candidatus Hippenecus merdae]
FGMRAEEVEELSRSGYYSAMAEADRDPRLSLIREQLVNGFFKKSGTDFWGIYDELFNKNDEYFVLKDFDSYVRGFEHLSECYDDRSAFAKKSLVNIAKSAYFSSDRTIKEYAGDIWKL